MRCLPLVTPQDSSNAALQYQQESSTPVRKSGWPAVTFDFMKERRPLTDEQRADADRLMDVFKARQRAARDEGKKLTQENVAEMCGWSGQSAFGQFARGDVPLNLKTLIMLSKVLQFDPAEVSPSLASLIESAKHDNVAEPRKPYITGNQYPLISWVAAGGWQESCDNFHPGDADEWIESAENAGPHGYWLSVKGPSMMPDFAEGSRILVKPEGFDLVSGRLYIARLKDSGETTFKQYLRDSGNGYLQPLNPAFPVMPITENVEIIGEVIDGKMKPSLFR